MPRKKRGSQAILIDRGDQPPEIAEIAMGDAEVPADIENVLGELGGDVSRVVLFRKPPRGSGKYEFVGEMDADAFTLRSVQEQFGPGEYLARPSSTDPDGNVTWLPARSFAIAAPAAPAASVATASGGGGEVVGVMKELLAEMRANRAQPSDPAVMMQAVASMGGVVATQLQTLLPLIAQAQAPDKMMDLFVRAMEFARENMGADDGGYTAVLRELGKPLVGVLQRESERKEVGPGLLAPGPQQSPAAGGEMAGHTSPLWVQVIGRYVPHLVQFAQRGDDPSLLAAVLDDQRPKLAQWIEYRVAAEGVEAFTQVVCDRFEVLRPYRSWVVDFLTTFEMEGDTDQPGDEPGDEGTGGNEVTGGN